MPTPATTLATAIDSLRGSLASPNPKESSQVSVSRKALASVLGEVERLERECGELADELHDASEAIPMSETEIDQMVKQATAVPVAERRPVVRQSLQEGRGWYVSRDETPLLILNKKQGWITLGAAKRGDDDNYWDTEEEARAALDAWEASQQPPTPPSAASVPSEADNSALHRQIVAVTKERDETRGQLAEALRDKEFFKDQDNKMSAAYRDVQAQRDAAVERLVEVYSQCGNEAPAERRHALTPGIRDSIRDFLMTIKAWPKSATLPATEPGGGDSEQPAKADDVEGVQRFGMDLAKWLEKVEAEIRKVKAIAVGSPGGRFSGHAIDALTVIAAEIRKRDERQWRLTARLAAAEGVVDWLSQIASVLETLKRGFVTSVSSGTEEKYRIEIKFHTLAELQNAYGELITSCPVSALTAAREWKGGDNAN